VKTFPLAGASGGAGGGGGGILICGNIEKRRGCVKLRFQKETGKEEIRRNMEKEK
jgi:hypothetical protein